MLGTRWAYLAVTLVLVLVFGWTFFTNPGRPAPAQDPAYISWRTETLLVHTPDTFIQIDGPAGIHSTGYRLTTPVVTALMRRLPRVGRMTPTVVLAVALRVLIPLLLAGLAYRYRRDPLIFHAVAIGSGSLLLTPPFGGYLDNMIALTLVTAALYLLEASRTRWRARTAMCGLLIVAGLTHPTTMVIFCATLVLVAMLRRAAHRSAVGDGPILVTAAVAAAISFLIWNGGIWGQPASLTDAAAPPPGTKDFFTTRLTDWVAAIRPIPSAVLVVCGLVGLFASRRQPLDDLTIVSVAWLIPLLGVLGVATPLVYPYYRFFNSTIAWVLVAGLGTYFVIRYLVAGAKHRPAIVTGLGLGAIAVVLFTSFAAGLLRPHWNDPREAWIAPDERRGLDALTGFLQGVDAPIVFVIDHDVREPVRLYGFLKRAGNVSRYGVPARLQDRTSIYLGSLDDFRDGRETSGSDYYESLSRMTLDDARTSDPQIVVVAEMFNHEGSNAADFEEHGTSNDPTGSVLYLSDDVASAGSAVLPAERGFDASAIARWIRVVGGMLLLVAPGVLLTRLLLPDAGITDGAFAITIGVGLVAATAMCVLAITREPLTATNAWVSVGVAAAVAAGSTAASILRRADATETT